MGRLIVVLSCSLVACGGSTSSAPAGTLVRSDLICTETLPSGQAECEARGCAWGPPLWCSGVATEPEESAHDASRPCACTCHDDVMRCMSVP
ncbi:MAG: hypothetical protein U0234_11450 [Sandaracinus sp.]